MKNRMRNSVRVMMPWALAVLLAVSATGMAAQPSDVIDSIETVHLLIGRQGGSCSAVMIAPSRAVTAAHCLQIPNLVLRINEVDYPVSGSYVIKEGVDAAMLIAPSAPCPCASVKNTPENFYAPVYVVGYPYGLMRFITVGLFQGYLKHPEDLQMYGVTDARTAPGTSGGGVFNAQGALLGIGTATNEHMSIYVELAGMLPQ